MMLRDECRGLFPVSNKGQVSSQATNYKSKGKEVNTTNVKCGWFIHASRTLNQTHTFFQTRKLRACTATLISKRIIDHIPLRVTQDHFQKTYQVGVSMDKVFREKDLERKHVADDYTKQYKLLRDYTLELKATNPDTTLKINVCSEANPASPTIQFIRIYVCLGPLKKGFKACLRDLVGLDGAIMKVPFPGQWFLEHIGDDLELGINSNYTSISDRKKGLHTAICKLFPNAEHKYCIRHIHDNVRKKWGQTGYRDYLWRCASIPTIPKFEHLMKGFIQYDREACDWLKQIPLAH
uniref:MULE transposase domain-containing protein n=1 Tax=Lactuca sativa TaxID=4236 RepID=A0A9R1WQH3_LACSA|nr:hypothetical protein LSAT_V11C100029930 [Lactuca sativa]